MNKLLQQYMFRGFSAPEDGNGSGGNDGTGDGNNGAGGGGVESIFSFKDPTDDNTNGLPDDGKEEELEIFSAFQGNQDDTDDTKLEPAKFTEIPKEQVEDLQKNINSAIAQMGIKEDDIPTDFDPSDRTQMKAVLDKVVQKTVAQSLAVVFKPVQLALNQMSSQMQGYVQNEIKIAGVRNSAADVIQQQVPEFADPKYKGMLTKIDEQLREQKKTPTERAKILRQMLNQMGIGAKSKSNRTGAGDNNGTVREGADALKSLFG